LAALVESRIRRVERHLMAETEAGDDRSLQERMAHHAVPGVGLAVIADGEIAFEGSYGVREAGLPASVTATTRFQACSISKPITVLALLRLVERGLVDLDADVSDVLTSWRVPPNASWQPRITLEQIASHTAGLTVSGFPGYDADAPLPTVAQILTGTWPANTPGVRVDTLPGLQFRYSGGGTTVLQLVLEDVTGSPFADVMRELVLEPLGMRHSDYVQPLPGDLHGEAATAHGSDGAPLRGRWHVYPELAAAGLWTTPGDLARFAAGVQRASAGEGDAILGPELAASMLTPRIRSTDRMGGLDSVGLGLFLGGGSPATVFGHSGGNEGFRCHLLAHRTESWGVAVMTNGERGHVLVQEILDALGRALEWPDYAASELPDLPPSDDDLDRFVGTYEVRPGVTAVVSRRGGDLDVRLPGQHAVRFVRISDAEFGSFAVDATLRFDRVADDGTPELVIRQNDQEMTCRRLGDASARTG
jgi:CubicO group peptidase (beta-lactamase class C family)